MHHSLAAPGNVCVKMAFFVTRPKILNLVFWPFFVARSSLWWSSTRKNFEKFFWGGDLNFQREVV